MHDIYTVSLASDVWQISSHKLLLDALARQMQTLKGQLKIPDHIIQPTNPAQT